MKVELGAGAHPADGYLPVDVNPRHAAVVADALHLPFANASIDNMRAVDVLEHISYRDTERALTEWARVMRPGGDLFVQVPDAETIMRWFAADDPRLRRWVNFQGLEDSTWPLMGAQWRLLGGHEDDRYVDGDGDWRWNAHYSLWSVDDLRMHLNRAGFTVTSLEVNGHPNLLCSARRN